MNESSKKYWTDDPQLIEQYILGRLSPEEKKRLDDEIADCEPCKELLRREQALAAGIRQYGRSALKSRLRRRLRDDRSFALQHFHVIGLVAAVVIIAVGVGLYHIWFNDLVAPKRFGKREIVFRQSEPPLSEQKSKEPSQPEKASPSNENDQGASGQGKKDVGKLKRVDEPVKELSVTKTEERLGFANESPSTRSRPNATRSVETKSIWLLGTVVMVSDAKSQANETKDVLLMEARKKTSDVAAVPSSRQRKMYVQRNGGNEEIVLQQRSFNALPRSRQTQMGKKNRVETLLETNEQGWVLTIFSDALTAEEIENASVESTSPDSLVVSTPTQKIFYRLPADVPRSTVHPARP